jgi:sulfide dehydrogenase cytochrome subunit
MTSTRIITAMALLLISVSPLAAAGPADAPPGALGCTGCHATAKGVDATVPRLINRNPGDIVAAMEGFKSGQIPGTVMGRIAKGFTDAEIKAIAIWYGAQRD